MKILMIPLLALGLLGCEDKQCKAELQTCDARNQQTQKALDAAKNENAALRAKSAKMDELIAQVAALTTENETLKAAPPPPPAKAGKH
jgi:hypothetical protein